MYDTKQLTLYHLYINQLSFDTCTSLEIVVLKVC
jgi:hypothetical protein